MKDYARTVYWKGLSTLRQGMTLTELLVRRVAHIHQSDAILVRDSQRYWTNLSNENFRQYSHWKGAGIFADESRWLALGNEHFRLYKAFARAIGVTEHPKRILEWGCGGGVNATIFGLHADAYYGVDVSPASLEECGKQMAAAGAANFTPVLIEARYPEAVLPSVTPNCDLFLSTYVFELLPSPEYGIRVLKIAHTLLAPGAVALIQIKFSSDNWRTQARRWGYAKNLAWNATYRIDEFWKISAECGFAPNMITLVPSQPLVSDRNYAYFLLQRPV